jgi:hypothetical protein
MNIKKGLLIELTVLVLLLVVVGLTVLHPTKNGKEKSATKLLEERCETKDNLCCVAGTDKCIEAEKTECLEGYEPIFECTYTEGKCVPKPKCVKKEETMQEKTLEEKIMECKGHAFIVDKKNCFFELAVKEKNPLLCENIQTTEVTEDIEKMIEDCKRNVKIELVVLEGNQEKCSELEISFDEFTCIKKIALNKEDPRLCKEISYLSTYVECYVGIALKKKDVSICNEIKQSTLKQSCISKVAVESLNEELCLELESLATRDDCFYKIALEKNDASVCENISFEDMKKRCERRVYGQ